MNDDLAKALLAAANNASALENLCDGNGNADGATKANMAYNQLCAAAATANAKNAIQTLDTTADSQRRLTALTGQMNAVTQKLAHDESSVDKFVTLGTQAARLATALEAVPPNVAAGMSAITAISSTLRIG